MSRHLERGRLLLELGRGREAAAELAKAVALPGDDQADALALLALTEIDNGSMPRAAEHIAHAKSLAPQHPLAHWAAAVHATREQDEKRMRRELLGLRLSAPDDPAFIGLAARLHCDVEDYETALHLADEGLALDPNNEDCLQAAASSAANLGKYDAEDAFADRLLRVSPLLSRAHAFLARRALRAGDLAAASGHAHSALRLDPNDLNAHIVLLRVRPQGTFAFRLLEGRIGKWRIPVWLRVAILFLPMAGTMALYLALGRDTIPPWLNRLANPVMLAAIWLAGYFGWIGWHAIARAIRDRNARRAAAAISGELLAPVLPATIVIACAALHVAFGIGVLGVMAGAGILGLALMAVIANSSKRLRPVLCIALGGLFLLCVAGQVADAWGVPWAAPALFGFILTLAAALFVLFAVLGNKSQPTPPPLPLFTHEPPPFPR